MYHPSTKALFRHLEQTGAGGGSRRIARHLSRCERCRERLARLRRETERFAVPLHSATPGLPPTGEPCGREEDLLLFVTGRMPRSRRRQFEQHLASCPACLWLLREVRQESDLDSVRGGRAATPPAGRRHGPVWTWTGLFPPSRLFAPAAAAAVLALVVVLWVGHGRFSPRVELLAYQSVRTRDVPAFPVSSGTFLYPGDHLFMTWKSRDPGHLYLLHLNARTSRLRMLFPAPRIPLSNPLPGGREVRIPPDGGYWLLDDRPGEHLVLFLGDEEPWEEPEKAADGWEKALAALPAAQRADWLLDHASETYPVVDAVRFFNGP